MPILSSRSLCSKFGFQDGDLVFNACFDNFRPELTKSEMTCAALEKLIRDKLMPILPGVELEVWQSGHNPFRASEKTWVAAWDANVCVTVTWPDILAALEETR